MAEPLVAVVRDGFVESIHAGHVALVDDAGALIAGLGDPRAETYPRSALKPLQAIATLESAAEHGVGVDSRGVAIASASHEGTATHQVEAAYLLARAGLDESALRCPPATPNDRAALLEDPTPSALAHNCSGKHAGFLLAHAAGGEWPEDYLTADAPVQRRVVEVVERASGAPLTGPGVDGCGAYAWRLGLDGLARAFAWLAAAEGGQAARVRAAMTTHPELIGGPATVDCMLMRAQPGVVAKRGAEGVLAAGWCAPGGPRGLAVKIADGGERATAPVICTLLGALGAHVPEALHAPTILGGGEPHGAVRALPAVGALAIS